MEYLVLTSKNIYPNPMLHALMGFVATQLGDYAKGEDYLKKSLATEPTQAIALEGMIWLSLSRNERDRAHEFYARFKEAHPGQHKKIQQISSWFGDQRPTTPY